MSKKNKRIVVTGASKGVGYELTRKLLKLEHYVYAVSRSVNNLEKLAKTHHNLIVVKLDITKELTSLLEAIGSKNIDHVINNAGYLVNKPLDELSDNEILMQYNVNVIAPLRLVRDLLPFMVKGSTICNITSMGGVQGTSKFTGLSAYSSSKGALNVLTECLAEELSERNIKCNALALGAVQTEMLSQAFPGYIAPFSAEEMADYIARFILDTSKYFNGKILPVSVSTP